VLIDPVGGGIGHDHSGHADKRVRLEGRQTLDVFEALMLLRCVDRLVLCTSTNIGQSVRSLLDIGRLLYVDLED
jgi:hypothetical protein